MICGQTYDRQTGELFTRCTSRPRRGSAAEVTRASRAVETHHPPPGAGARGAGASVARPVCVERLQPARRDGDADRRLIRLEIAVHGGCAAGADRVARLCGEVRHQIRPGVDLDVDPAVVGAVALDLPRPAHPPAVRPPPRGGSEGVPVPAPPPGA